MILAKESERRARNTHIELLEATAINLQKQVQIRTGTWVSEVDQIQQSRDWSDTRHTQKTQHGITMRLGQPPPRNETAYEICLASFQILAMWMT
ncbi:Proline racemase [Fusarium oxysporum f. sp. albedinis]|nr:Proline racemase [Fusarium oxysporum f. sp. albedinis]